MNYIFSMKNYKKQTSYMKKKKNLSTKNSNLMLKRIQQINGKIEF